MVDIINMILTMPENYLYLFFALIMIIMFGMIFLIMIIMWTPAMTFMWSRFVRKPVFFLWGRDGIGNFAVPKKYENQYAFFKKHGPIGITRDSHVFEKKTKQTIYLADKDIGATIQREWPRIVEELKRTLNIRSGKEYKIAIENALKHQDDPAFNPDIFFKGSTVKVSDLAQFFPMNLKPIFIEGYAEVARREERRKQDNLKWLIGFGVFLICLGIATYMIIGQMNKDKTECSCNFGDSIKQVCGNINNNGGIETVTNGTRSVIPEVKQTNNGTAGIKLS